jgi:hypoxia-inducible factor 1 alpha
VTKKYTQVMEKKQKAAPKDKRRNNEKRKEKSRDAARSRRSKETEVFTDLATVLPVPQEQVSQLDKASVMRLAIAYLRVRDMINLVPEPPEPDDHKILVDDSIFLKSLEGFLVVMSSEGDIVYMSENVSDYLGITQIDLMGQNIFEYSHPCDHEEIKEILSAKTREESETPKSFFIRLKCTLTSKGRSVNLKSATYKVIHCTGHIIETKDDTDEEGSKGGLRRCLVAVGQPIPHPSNIEAPLPRQTFLTKHSLDMKFTDADDKIMMDVLGYDSEDLVGKSVYEYHHAMDSDSICSAFKCLFSKGQCETNRYRFLAKTGGYVWVLTQATLINDSKTMKPQSVVCVNYVISGVECKDEIYSSSQLASVKTENSCKNTSAAETVLPVVVVEKVADETGPFKKSDLVKNRGELLPSYSETGAPKPPLTATSKIFAPRTEEMNKGFLTFSDDEPGLTMLKDEPDDLTHLAPVAGDVCVPLDDHPFLTDKMLDDFLLRDSFEPLLTDEPTDPFISYRDSYDSSPQLLSPNVSKNSECSLPSLNSPSDSLSDEDRLSTFMNLHTEEETDLVAKAPYITMNMGDDLPLLMSDDLMWNSNEKSRSSPDSSSSLAQLLCSSINKHSRSNDHGGGLIQSDQMIDMDDYYNKKNSSLNGKSSPIASRLERTNKRSNTSSYETNTKRSRNEPKETMSSELLQQLMSNNHHRGRPKGKSNWLLDSGGQKAACISQPSDSVLMNLLDDQLTAEKNSARLSTGPPDSIESRQSTIRKNSLSLLDPDATAIPSLLDLTQQDFEVNAPVNSLLLQGTDLLTALDISGPI